MTTMRDPRDEKFLEALKVSELGAKIAADIDDQRAAERTQVAAELERLNSAVEKDLPKLTAVAEKALADFKKAEAALQAARAKVGAANAAKLSASVTYTARRNELERELTLTASPLIEDARQWVHAELRSTRKALRTRYWTERHAITGRRQDCSESNIDSVNARVAALTNMLDALSDLALIADQSRVPEILENMKAALPQVGEV